MASINEEIVQDTVVTVSNLASSVDVESVTEDLDHKLSENGCVDVDLDNPESADNNKTLSKNQQRKLRREEMKLVYRQKRRIKNREARKLQNKMKYEKVVLENTSSESLNDKTDEKEEEEVKIVSRKELVNQQKMEINMKLRKAKNSAPKVCIDLSFDSCMNDRERSQLSDHIQRIYGSNKKSTRPFHVILCNFSHHNPIYDTCIKKHHGFLNYIIDFYEKGVLDVYSNEEIIYLTPDSENVLESLENDRVYILGGLVDLSVKKNQTMEFASAHKIRTACLPILKYMQMDKRTDNKHSFKRILSINQVFDILLKFYETNCWEMALEYGMPKRHGYYLPENDKDIVPNLD